jgi:sulfonate transport system permease protein
MTGSTMPTTRRGGFGRRLGRACRRLALLTASLAVVLGLWTVFIKAQHLSSYFAKTPADVWNYVATGPAAAGNRALLWSNLLTTLRDTFAGYVLGTAGAAAAAMVLVSSRAAYVTVMPVAIALISVPLVAMVPLIILAFGRGIPGVLVIGAIVTFFPSLVFLMQGLRSVPADASALFRVYAAPRLITLWKLRLPCAVPALFASARVSVPAAMLGAVLAEYLATGQGLGFLMASASVTSDFAALWAAVVLITAVSAVLYSLISSIERRVIRRFTPGRV